MQVVCRFALFTVHLLRIIEKGSFLTSFISVEREGLLLAIPNLLAKGAIASFSDSCFKEKGHPSLSFCVIPFIQASLIHNIKQKKKELLGSFLKARFSKLAEREGFEPPVPLGTTVFKTVVIDHSTISPKVQGKSDFRIASAKVQKVFITTKLFECFFANTLKKLR